MKRITVFCGSNMGNNEQYAKACKELAQVFIKKDIGLVYGGGNLGLMGTIADEMIKGGGDVIGVIPQKLVEMEVCHMSLKDLRIVSSMHERKALMADLADAFIALPGGIGTLEELIEVFTWNQLGYHSKPCGALNTNNYYELLKQFLVNMVNTKFLREEHKNTLIFEEDPERLVERLLSSKVNYMDKRIK
jgi:uncharacterized protein (TIGR00730 family)